MRAAGRGMGANDIVVQYCANGGALLLGPLEEAVTAEQSLLLARNRGEEQRRAIAALAIGARFAEEARRFYADGHTRGIVVRSGSIGLRVHHVRGPRVEVAGDDENGFGKFCIGSRKKRVDTFERQRLS